MSSVTKKVVDGKVAVLVSPGFGAGWSTWGGEEYAKYLLFDMSLVELAERKAPEHEVEEHLKKVFGEAAYIYTGGWCDIKVEWLPEGTAFTVEEYDGSESLRTVADLAHVA